LFSLNATVSHIAITTSSVRVIEFVVLDDKHHSAHRLTIEFALRVEEVRLSGSIVIFPVNSQTSADRIQLLNRVIAVVLGGGFFIELLPVPSTVPPRVFRTRAVAALAILITNQLAALIEFKLRFKSQSRWAVTRADLGGA